MDYEVESRLQWKNFKEGDVIANSGHDELALIVIYKVTAEEVIDMIYRSKRI
jgi:hypothetical protein